VYYDPFFAAAAAANADPALRLQVSFIKSHLKLTIFNDLI
jgi:hypothetical protein